MRYPIAAFQNLPDALNPEPTLRARPQTYYPAQGSPQVTIKAFEALKAWLRYFSPEKSGRLNHFCCIPKPDAPSRAGAVPESAQNAGGNGTAEGDGRQRPPWELRWTSVHIHVRPPTHFPPSFLFLSQMCFCTLYIFERLASAITFLCEIFSSEYAEMVVKRSGPGGCAEQAWIDTYAPHPALSDLLHSNPQYTFWVIPFSLVFCPNAISSLAETHST